MISLLCDMLFQWLLFSFDAPVSFVYKDLGAVEVTLLLR